MEVKKFGGLSVTLMTIEVLEAIKLPGKKNVLKQQQQQIIG